MNALQKRPPRPIHMRRSGGRKGQTSTRNNVRAFLWGCQTRVGGAKEVADYKKEESGKRAILLKKGTREGRSSWTRRKYQL